MSFPQLNRKPIEVLTDKEIPRDIDGQINANPYVCYDENFEVVSKPFYIWVNEERDKFDFNDLAKGMFSYLGTASNVYNDKWKTYKKAGIEGLRPDLVDTSIRGKRIVPMFMFERLAFSICGLAGQMYLDGYPNWQSYLMKGVNYIIQPGQYEGTSIIKVGKYDEGQETSRLSVYCNKEKAAGQKNPFVRTFCDAHTINTSFGEQYLKDAFGVVDEEHYEKTKKIRYLNSVNGDNELFDLFYLEGCPDIVFNEDETFDNISFLKLSIYEI